MRARSLPIVAAAIAGSAAGQNLLQFRELRRSVPPEASVVAQPWESTRPSVGDVDADGDLDMLQAQRVLENDGGGVFTTSWLVPLPPDSWWGQGELADVDGDGDLDLLCVLGHWQTDRFWTFLNDGLGHFSPTSAQYAFGGFSYVGRFDTGDLDGDGDVDVLVPRHYDTDFDFSVALYNDGSGNWSPLGAPQALRSFYDHLAVQLVDLDADGDLDAFADGDPSPNESLGFGVPDAIAVNGGANTFTLLPGAPSSVATAFTTLVDVDGDIDLDLWFNVGSLWRNDGALQFSNASSGLPGLPPAMWLIGAGDLDGDGDVDGLAGGLADALTLFNDGTGAFTAGPSRPQPMLSSGATVDVDRDGDVDFLHGDGVLFNPGDGELRWPSGVGVGYRAFADFRLFELGVADLDGDRDTDVFVSDGISSALYTNTGAAGLEERATSGLTDERHFMTAFADLDGDVDVDFVAVSEQSSLHVLLNDGAGAFAAGPPMPPIPFGSLAELVCADLDGDGDTDVLGGTWPPRVWINGGGAVFSESLGAWPAAALAGQLAAGDLDADADIDVVAASSSDVSVLLNDGFGRFTLAGSVLGPGGNVTHLLLGDVDGDGDLDLAASVFLGSFGFTRLALNDGAATFANASSQLPPIATSRAAFALVDLDGDEHLDLCFDRYDDLVLAKNDGAGHFSEAGALTSNRYAVCPSSFFDADFDGDLDAFAVGRSGPSLLVSTRRQVAWRTPPRIGRDLEFELHGLPGRFFMLYGSLGRAFLPFGEHGTLMVDRSQLVYEVLGRYDTQGRAIARRDVPADAALVGLELYWQTYSAARRRFSNLEVTRIESY